MSWRRRGPPWLWVLLLGWAVGAGAAPDQAAPPYEPQGRCRNEETEYLNEDYGVCCAKCPPGMYAAQQCTSDVNTVCLRCGSNTHTEVWNYISQCRACRPCPRDMGLEEAISCSPTQNAECTCMAGKHCGTRQWQECKHCDDHTACHAGSEVARPGSALSDTECSPCREGFYQNQTSLEARCQPHTDCVSQGLQVVSPGTATSDAHCSKIPNTVIPTVLPPDTKDQEWRYWNPIIILVTGVLISISLILTVIMIRNPSVYKQIGMHFRRGRQPENLETKTEMSPPLLSDEMRNPENRGELRSEYQITDRCLEDCDPQVVFENLQHESTTGRPTGGPYLQESGPTSPSLGPCLLIPSGTVPSSDLESTSPEQTKNIAQQTAGSSDGTHISAGGNHGVQIQGTNVTYNGNIYIYHQPAAMPPPMPPGLAEGSARVVQVTTDTDEIPTSIPEQGRPPAEPPLPFSLGSEEWHCISPQQEEGKDIHLTTEESIQENMWPEELNGYPYISGNDELGRSLQALPDDKFY
ncbi:tumor necrosis factor receptor superfamily member 3-like [Ambystoma mexicanum]|uniref:tumor necrosis factor receptor superfamily member 3-like n=1 Tax=Ambystoma mexicanum TaxID=8296 RepID=UPI0037E962C6